MTELKTLKNLEEQDWSMRKEDIGLIKSVFFDLRQEAIKWIKELTKETQTNDCDYCGGHHITGGCIKSEWIKHFFNITEEEVKSTTHPVRKVHLVKQGLKLT